MKRFNFPKRFENEGVNPYTVPCKLVHCVDNRVFEQVMENIEVADSVVNLSDFMGPFADKHEGKWCVRFETKTANDCLSS